MNRRWGQSYSKPDGFIAEPGSNEFQHRFGGTPWQVEDSDHACGGPALLLTLDLHDPNLAPIAVEGIMELPLCSYINGSPWSSRQVYQIVPQDRRVFLVERKDTDPECDSEDGIPNPLPEHQLRLRPMSTSEYPTDYDTYMDAFDNFAGGGAFIRILGTPLVTDVMTAVCTCGRTMQYVASIGCQSPMADHGLMADEPFFIGEGYLYFFLCQSCLKFQVDSQGS